MGASVISVEDAKKLISETILAPGTTMCDLSESVGKTLAETVYSPYPLPFFDNSAMDGYALLSADTASASAEQPVTLALAGMIAAGDTADGAATATVRSGTAVQVLTGAPVASGADAVIRQEDVVVKGNNLEILRPVQAGQNIRQMGEELKQGETLLEQGSLLTPAAIGTLSSVGIKAVSVYKAPRIGVIVTGSEIISDPADLRPGRIFDSNSHTLLAALKPLNVELHYCGTAMDTVDALTRAVNNALASVDILLITGGVSVGRFDYVKEVAEQSGIREIFWRIRQKPGKPLFFGASGGRDKIVFGLPGNPASVLVCFYEYVRPALLQAAGARAVHLQRMQARLQQPVKKNTGLTHYLKGKLLSDGTVEILDRQGSHMMSSFAVANCLVVIPESTTELQRGAEVEVHLLPL
jgi:molybdopterin molybdotransferase